VNFKKETVTMILGKVEEQLSSDNFYRISRSFVINIDFLKKVNTKQSICILSKNGNDFHCPISREKISDLVELMKNR